MKCLTSGSVEENAAGQGLGVKRTMGQIAMAAALACLVVWASYGFEVGHVREAMNLSAQSMPSFQHFPAPLARAGKQLILANPLVPAPALLDGAAAAWVLNQERPPAYLLGHIKSGGWWYFFLVGVAVKSPLPVLFLSAIGLVVAFGREWRRWRALAPALAAFAILLVTMPVKYDAGVRHVLIVFPLLCIMAGCGCGFLWDAARGGQADESAGTEGRGARIAGRGLLIALLAWQVVSTVRGGKDFLAYFNELAGRDPSRVLVAGCDLDCGQDVFRLARELKTRGVSHATIAVWTSAEPQRMGLPPFDVPQPYRPVTGWFAISARARRFGDLFHDRYPADGFDWLKAYQPVERVGETIWLYDIPAQKY